MFLFLYWNREQGWDVWEQGSPLHGPGGTCPRVEERVPRPFVLAAPEDVSACPALAGARRRVSWEGRS